MITAELSHNPYLLETTVKFNGHDPRINSQIEKYEGMTLKDWVEKVPKLFYDEMNGYDFDLAYSGTHADFMEVKKAFDKEGVSCEDVRLFHKNELEDVDTKSAELDELFGWLQSHPNRKFPKEEFFEENSDLMDRFYPYIILHGRHQGADIPKVSIEEIDSAEELENTILVNTPVLFCIDEAYAVTFRKDLAKLLSRDDVTQCQLFFMIHPQLNMEQMRRVLIDLGVDEPQIVNNFNDGEIIHYLRNYPVTEYVRTAIATMEDMSASIEEKLAAENEENAKNNISIYEEIDRIENNLSTLKSIDLFFLELDNYNIPHEFELAKQTFTEKVRKWRNRRTKVVGEMEGQQAATEFDNDIAEFLSGFLTSIITAYQQSADSIRDNFRENYEKQNIDTEFNPGVDLQDAAVPEEVPSITDCLLELKVVTYEQPHGDLIDLFWKPAGREEKSPVRVVTCYFEQWRDKALEMLLPVTEGIINQNLQQLEKFYTNLASSYHDKLQELIALQTSSKDAVTSKLSEEDRKLQEDNDWLQALRDKLFHIERG